MAPRVRTVLRRLPRDFVKCGGGNWSWPRTLLGVAKVHVLEVPDGEVTNSR